jgi:hypothetical protein
LYLKYSFGEKIKIPKYKHADNFRVLKVARRCFIVDNLDKFGRYRGHARPGGQHRHGGQPEHGGQHWQGESAEGIWLLEVSIRYFTMENVVLEGMVDMVDNMEIGAIASMRTLQTKTNWTWRTEYKLWINISHGFT